MLIRGYKTLGMFYFLEILSPRILSNPWLFIFQIIPPRSGTQRNPSASSGDNAKGVPPMSRVHLRSHRPIPDCDEVPPTAPQVPQGNVMNIKFYQSIHIIAQIVVAQAKRGTTSALSTEATKVR